MEMIQCASQPCVPESPEPSGHSFFLPALPDSVVFAGGVAGVLLALSVEEVPAFESPAVGLDSVSALTFDL